MVEECPECKHNTLDYKGLVDNHYFYRCIRIECSYQEIIRPPFESKTIDEKLNIIYKILKEIMVIIK